MGDFILKNFFEIPISIILLNPIFKSIKYKVIRSKIKGGKYSISINGRIITKFLKLDNIDNTDELDEIKHLLESMKN